MESKEDAAVERQKLVPDDGEIEPDDEQPINNIITPIVPKTVTQTPISPVLSHKIFSSGETSRTQDSSNCSVGRGGNSESGPHSARLIYVNERKTETNKQPDYKAKARRIQREQDDGPATITTTIDQHQQKPPTDSTFELASIAPTLPQTPPPPINTTTIVTHTSSSTTITPSQSTTTHPKHSLPNNNNIDPTATHAVANDLHITFDERGLKHHSFLSEVPDVRHMERALLGLLEDFHLGKLKAFGSGCTMEQMTDIREQQESLAKLHFELGAGGDPQNSNSNLNAQENMSQLVAKLENLSVSIERLNSSNTNL